MENFSPHPLIILSDLDECILENIVEYIHTGKVNIRESNLDKFLHTAAKLKSKGGQKISSVSNNNEGSSMQNC